MIGEGSNSYSAGALFPGTAERMARYRPDMRIVYMVRDPMVRMVSAWVQTRVDSGDAVPARLDDALRTMPDTYLDQSLYWKTLSLYRDHFPDSQILVGFLEDMNADGAAFFARLTDFLGISRMAQPARPHQNPSRGKRLPTPAYTALRRLPGVATAKGLVPESVRTRVRTQLLSRPIDRLPPISPDLRRELRDIVRPDAARLLSHCGKPEDFWPSC